MHAALFTNVCAVGAITVVTTACAVGWVQILEGTVSIACQHVSMMHRLIDSVALLDMLASFALAVGTCAYLISTPHPLLLHLQMWNHWTLRCQLDMLNMEAPGRKDRMQRQAWLGHGGTRSFEYAV